jgi:hypothetical protein
MSDGMVMAKPEKLMTRTLAIAFLGMFAAVSFGNVPTLGATATPDSENGRFMFNEVTDGVLRLDTRTVQVSMCIKRSAGWACELVPDERTALENEITRLQTETAILKREMIARGVPLPGGMRPDLTKPAPQIELKLPSDAEVDRVMAFLEKVWRRLIDLVQSMKDADRKG